MSRDGVDDSGMEKATVAPPQGTLLWAEGEACCDFRWRREEDQEVPAGWGEEEEEEEVGAASCRALLYMEARRAFQELERSQS